MAQHMQGMLRLGAAVQHTLTGSCSDPAPAGLIWRAASGSPSPAAQALLVLPASSPTHTLLLLPQHTPGKSCSLLS